LTDGTVLRIYRYPVKSMGGEEVERAYVGADGLQGDRAYAVLDLEAGTAASAKNIARFSRLLEVKATLTEDGLSLMFPDGKKCGLPDAAGLLTAYLGRRVILVNNEGRPLTYQGLEVSYETHSTTYFEKQGVTRAGSFHDSAPVHIMPAETLSTHGLEMDEVCRFRPNIVIDFGGELKAGTFLEAGGVVFKVLKPTKRCVMVVLPQQSLDYKPELLKNLRQLHGGVAGVYAEVVREGWVSRGDRIRIYSSP